MKNLLGDSSFIYGGYRHEPSSLPYGNYAEQAGDYIRADDRTLVKVHSYIVRIVTESKDFALEDKVEDLFDELEIPYTKITAEDLFKQHVFCAEWIIDIID